MDLKTQFAIRGNPYITNYLKENSNWYKTLSRNPDSIRQLIQETKEYYHLTTKDKIENIGKRIELLKNFIDILN